MIGSSYIEAFIREVNSMKRETPHQSEKFYTSSKQEDVVINLTLAGARDRIMDLLDRMDAVGGFSVLEGSFITSKDDLTPQ